MHANTGAEIMLLMGRQFVNASVDFIQCESLGHRCQVYGVEGFSCLYYWQVLLKVTVPFDISISSEYAVMSSNVPFNV